MEQVGHSGSVLRRMCLTCNASRRDDPHASGLCVGLVLAYRRFGRNLPVWVGQSSARSAVTR